MKFVVQCWPGRARFLQHWQSHRFDCLKLSMKNVLVESLKCKPILRMNNYTWKQNWKCLGNVERVVACWTWTELAASKKDMSWSTFFLIGWKSRKHLSWKCWILQHLKILWHQHCKGKLQEMLWGETERCDVVGGQRRGNCGWLHASMADIIDWDGKAAGETMEVWTVDCCVCHIIFCVISLHDTPLTKLCKYIMY